jgi:hypothetical protein
VIAVFECSACGFILFITDDGGKPYDECPYSHQANWKPRGKIKLPGGS